MTDERLREIEERAKAATPGPWGAMTPAESVAEWGVNLAREAEDTLITAPHPYGVNAINFVASVLSNGAQDVVSPADAAFIAAAREDVPALVAEIRRLRGARELPCVVCGDDELSRVCRDCAIDEWASRRDEEPAEPVLPPMPTEHFGGDLGGAYFTPDREGPGGWAGSQGIGRWFPSKAEALDWIQDDAARVLDAVKAAKAGASR